MPRQETGEYVVDEETAGPDGPRPRIWPLVLIVSVLSIAMVMYGMYHSNQYEQQLAEHLIAQFHGVLAEQDWERLYSESDPRFKEKYSEGTAVAMFQSVSTHMGTPVSSKIETKHMTRGDGGSYIFTTVETTFTNQAKGLERISWHETNGVFQLNDYSIQPER